MLQVDLQLFPATPSRRIGRAVDRENEKSVPGDEISSPGTPCGQLILLLLLGFDESG